MASIRKRGSTFTITAYMGYDEQGKQRKKTTTFRPPDGVTTGKAEKLAKAFAANWEDKIKGYVALDENRTFADLAKWYYESVAPSVLKPNVLAGYKKGIYDHIIPVLGNEKLKNITPPMLDSLFAELQRSGNMEKHFLLKDKELLGEMKRDELAKRAGVERSTLFNILRGYTTTPKTAEKIAAALDMKVGQVFDDVTENKGLSGASTNKLKLNLSAIFTAAVKKEIMRRNPCRLATPPKVDTPPASYLNEEQCREFLSLLRERADFQLKVICNLFIASGIRAGELCALYWEDLNLETGILHIRHTLAKVGEEYIRQAPKTQESVRYILLPAYILELLKRHKTEQAKARLKAAEWKDTELLFTNQTGGFLLGTNLNARLKRVIRGTDLPQDLHIHSLRHTFASLLINSNVAARVIADRLGHSTTKTTLDTYSHVFAASEVKAMQAIDMALFQGQ